MISPSRVGDAGNVSRVLRMVASRGPITTASTAKAVQMDHETVRKIVVELSGRGLVVRKSLGGHKALHLEVTEAGRAAAGPVDVEPPPSQVRLVVVQGFMVPCLEREAERREDCQRYSECLDAHCKGQRLKESKLEWARCPVGCRWFSEDVMHAVEFARTGLSASSGLEDL